MKPRHFESSGEDKDPLNSHPNRRPRPRPDLSPPCLLGKKGRDPYENVPAVGDMSLGRSGERGDRQPSESEVR